MTIGTKFPLEALGVPLNKVETQGAEKTLSPRNDIEKAATDFEALLLHQMLQSMQTSSSKGGLFSGGSEEATFTDMLYDQVAHSIAENQSIGVKRMIAKDIERLEKK